jgi:Linalool dehydratase/isomerase
MTQNKPHCIECEPNACFPECNQHPILSFMLYDSLYGTTLTKASDKFMDFFLEEKMIHPNTHETAMLYLIKQDVTLSNQDPRYKNILDMVITPVVSSGAVSLKSASADGWTGAFMYPWQPEYIRRHYPYMKESHLVEIDDEKSRLAMTIWEPQLKYGFFAVLAAEMGDLETREKLIKFADDKYKPVHENGALKYPASNIKGANNLTGKLIALARANRQDGLFQLHNQPFDEKHFTEPKVTGVDFPNIFIKRAVFDRDRRALVISTVPGIRKEGNTFFKVEMLDISKTYHLVIDGKEQPELSGTESLQVEISLDREHEIIIKETKP